ncbi:Long-chain-fatty-acid--CoA ligase [Defluviimonas aquaemixtae]|uniref:Long-chain-fatty-acid--CoA ligase n=1 Tax=Albidovulum aquaemixtae TaxID=1542388 RepID=A0A2R8B866_9RHOB|nr:acyl-CoA synthetase [Defluviimonas aquaemixtae]SPH18784.1 Long-chain-fatty-acid--CoA ligase [Defluviimonas aquaemixtae]
MARFAGIADRDAVEQEMPYEKRDLPVTLYQFLSRTRDAHGARNAVSFQILSDPKSKAETWSWNTLLGRVNQTANLFRDLGIGEKDVVAYLLPNSLETAATLLGGAVAGIVNPINPLLEPEQIAAILRETNAKVLVTLKAFPKTDVPQKAAEALKLAPGVQTVLEVDLNRYLSPPKSWIVPLVRPKISVEHKAVVKDFNAECAKMPADRLSFEDSVKDRVAAYFHTGGTTGMPKVAQHKYSGMIYNGWLGGRLLFDETDVLICPLPLFHVFAAYPVFMSVIAAGAHMIMPTPAGYRGDGVFDNFWKLIERWQVSFLITVPTAIAALMQRPVDANVSSLKTAISGSAPLPLELYRRFEEATGVQIAEGYGLTEATCMVSCNPINGEKRVGSVGIPLPYSHVRILHTDADGTVRTECGVDEVGEICVSNPGVFEGSTYTEVDKNRHLFAEGRYLRTGDLGRLDPDGYLWITGRAKDLIIRGGHNIDPAEIEEALAGHPAIAFAGAIGQPDAFAGELPCAYVELVDGASVTVEELLEHAKAHIHERAAIPKHIEILPELPKTAVGKIFKPALRKLAIQRVYDAALTEAGFAVRVREVTEDKKRGLVACLKKTGDVDEEALKHKLGEFTRPWDWAE